MRSSRRVRREPGPAGLLLAAAVGTVVALAVVGFLAVVVGREIGHRTDSSWHYEQVTLTECSPISQNRYQGISSFCTFATVPPLPFAIDPHLDVSGDRRHPPRSTTEWVHVVNGRITGTAGRAPLWVLVFLIIPAVLLAGSVYSVRAAGRRRRELRGNRRDLQGN